MKTILAHVLYLCNKYFQKLEEKFNAKEEKKVQQQTTLKVQLLMQNLIYGLQNVSIYHEFLATKF